MTGTTVHYTDCIFSDIVMADTALRPSLTNCNQAVSSDTLWLAGPFAGPVAAILFSGRCYDRLCNFLILSAQPPANWVACELNHSNYRIKDFDAM